MKKITLRLDDDLHERVEQAADRDKRSLNGQLEWLIQTALDNPPGQPIISGKIYAYSQDVYDVLRAAGLPVVPPGETEAEG